LKLESQLKQNATLLSDLGHELQSKDQCIRGYQEKVKEKAQEVQSL